MASDNIQNPASRLQRIEDMIQTLKLMISILRPALRCIFKWQSACQTLKVHFDNLLESQVLYVIWDFQPYGSGWTQVLADETWKSSPRTAELVATSLTELKLIRQDMIGIHGIVSRASRSISSESTKNVVINNISPLLENLKDILRCKADAIVPVREEIEELAETLREMKIFLSFVENQCRVPERMRYLWAHAEIVAVNITCLLYFCLVEDKMEADKALAMKNDLSELIRKIKPASPEVREIYTHALETLRSSKAHAPIIDQHVLSFVDLLIDNLKERSKNKEKVVNVDKDQTEILLEELRLLRYNLLDPPLQAATEEWEAIMIVEIVNVINETGYFVYFSSENEGNESDTEENEDIVGTLNHVLSCLLRNIMCISEKIADLDDELPPRLSVLSYPRRTFEMTSLYVTIRKVDMLHRQIASCNPLKHQIERVFEELLSLRDDFDRMEKRWKRNETFQYLLGHFGVVAEYAEHLIFSFLYSPRSLWWQKLGLFYITKEIKLIQSDVKAFQAKMRNDNVFYNKHSPGMVSSQANPPNSYAAVVSKNEVGNSNQIVGLKEETETLIEQLTRGSEQLRILSIVGMPGLGKTTLANLVYQHRSVSFHFHVRASCFVSQIYQKDTLLHELLCQINGETNQGNENDAKDFAEQLHKCLKGKRYLVIIDDVWDIKVLYDLVECFPDDKKGSRILITTRQHKVALVARSLCHSLHLLSDYESWELLQIKLFQEESCPPELIHVGKCIAKGCQGLPLAVVLLAGLLERVERTKYCWERIAYRLRSHTDTYRQVYHTLELSYNHLPEYLKPCFLYFVLLVRKTEIPVKKLVKLWIAQGFVKQSRVSQNSLEHEAENYLNDLISRSLVMISKRSSKGAAKSCRVHDVIQDFCLAKAEQETLMQQQDWYDELSSVSDFLMQCRRPSIKTGPNVSDFGPGLSCPPLKRVPLFDDVTDYAKKRLQSAIPTPSPRNSPLERLTLKFFNSRVRCRVLDLGNVPIECCASTDDLVLIAELVHLRYLAVRVCTKKIPSVIGYLCNLQTLILNGAIGELELPETIWEIMTLRHILMEDAFFRFPQNFSENLAELANLKTVSTVCLPRGNATRNIVRRLPSLQKLRCRLSDSLDDSISCNHFPTLDTLTQLESLKVFFGQMLRNCKFSLPSQLKKLTLSNSCLPWNEISTIGRLPNLVVLKLLDRSFEGHQWDMEEGEFQKLKFLKLDLLNIAQWNFSSEHLPSLEHLVVQRCKKLKELPITLGEIPTLRIIEVKDCDSSVMHSIRLIEEDQREMGNEELKVYIKM